jgi:tight adherence protein C
MLIILVAALLALTASFAIGLRTAARPALARRRLVEGARGDSPSAAPPQQSARRRVVDPLVTKLAHLAVHFGKKNSVESVRTRLHAAGLARTVSPQGYLAGKMLVAIGGLVIGATTAGIVGSGTRAILLAAALVFGAFVIPDFMLSRRAKHRLAQADAELPRVIDLLAICVEAGLGFDAALVKVLERFQGVLSEELGTMLTEMRVGSSRQSALSRLTERVPSPAVAGFAHSIIQADQLGISLSRILRVQAEEIRNKQRTAAEERAMKAPIKMLFPTVIFILPALFVVSLGPPILSLRGHGF